LRSQLSIPIAGAIAPDFGFEVSMNKPMPLWKIVLLWLAVGIGCVAWTYRRTDRHAEHGTYRT
jgi:hypothetical protein